ncbi:hypothetical protein, partial [Candidatus Bandiella numerosa]|uniref:hypothetical protein n=1 Tax=Candidatus Bandiella numerosa TaxID=2570586 RepID=UPI001F3342FE
FLEFLLFYQLLYQTYRSSLYESNFLNPFIAYLPCFAFMQRPFLKKESAGFFAYLEKNNNSNFILKLELIAVIINIILETKK